MNTRKTLSSSCGSLKLALVFAAPIFIAAVGCGGSGSSSAPPASKPTVSVSASPATVSAGSSSTLTVAASNATGVTLSGSDGTTYTMAATGGTASVTPSATTTYTASASGAGGSASAAAKVTVSAPAPAATVTITASPTSVSAGGSSTLTVVAANATKVVVAGSDGTTYTLSVTGGTQVVTPAATTTYTATASGAGASATAKATVTLVSGPAPTITVAASPTSIGTGGSSTLTVVAANATQVTIAGSDNTTYKLAAAGGTQVVTPAATTTYTASATGAGGTVTATAEVTVTATPATAVTITAIPTSINAGSTSTLTVVATNASGAVVVTGSDSSTYTLTATGGTQAVTPAVTTTYTATAPGTAGSVTATATVSVGSVSQVKHVVFMLQENRTFDSYFGMLNPYRQANSTNGQLWDTGDDGNTYTVDGIDDKLSTVNESDEGVEVPLYKFASTCIDDDSSAWISSYGDANRYDFSATRKIKMDGFVHTAEGFANACIRDGNCNGAFTDTAGVRSMGYFDEDYLNYYYYMASQFAVSDRWFSPIASKSTPNRVATYTGGTTQGLVYDPGYNDHVGGVAAKSIFQELDQAGVTWKVYYSLTQGLCTDPEDCTGGGSASYPSTNIGYVFYPSKYLYPNPTGAACTGTTVGSAQVGDTSNYYCVDPNHIAPLSKYYSDVANDTLASFSFIEAGYGVNDEHPGSGQPVLYGQAEMAKILNAFMTGEAWKDSVFFFAYDEGGGPYDHVPPVPGHSNDFTDKSLGTIPDIASISVSPDAYKPCLPPVGVKATSHCDLRGNDPGAQPTDVSNTEGFGAQIGFRVPNMVISQWTRRHYVSHIPMDHTAVIKFVENRFIGPNAHLTARDAVQPSLLDFFDFTATPWATPPTPPTPYADPAGTKKSCTPTVLGQ